MKKKISLDALQVDSFVTGASNLAKTIKGGEQQYTDLVDSVCFLCNSNGVCPSDMPANCKFTKSPTCPDLMQ